MLKPFALIGAGLVIVLMVLGTFALGLFLRLLAGLALLSVVVELLARLRASRVAMDRDRFAWRRLLLRRSVPVDDVVRFHAQAQSDGEGGTSYVLIADLAPSAQATIWSDDSEALVNHLCAYLNEALFVVSAKERPRVPYR